MGGGEGVGGNCCLLHPSAVNRLGNQGDRSPGYGVADSAVLETTSVKE